MSNHHDEAIAKGLAKHWQVDPDDAPQGVDANEVPPPPPPAKAVAESKHKFKITWGWGGAKTFPDERTMNQWRGENEDEIAGMFPPRRHVLGADGKWHELAEDFCRECGMGT